ncbi:hypothetical protein LJC63_02620 [Ruminococcaceae bacterium OttesenSCG-928-L11]|nr:hypothetical protein [Ruminococcaceae bacterium OttesenSCG-928-L11]
MNGESLAIIAIVLLMCAMFLRARKQAAALLALPLTSVPAMHLIGRGIARLLPRSDFMVESFPFLVILAGAVIGSAACGLLSLAIPKRRGKTIYVLFSVIFQVAISVGYWINLL